MQKINIENIENRRPLYAQILIHKKALSEDVIIEKIS